MLFALATTQVVAVDAADAKAADIVVADAATNDFAAECVVGAELAKAL